MPICNVCDKKTLLPERFGEINLCKICFLKINGPLWKRQYEKRENAEKHRCKALESAHKQNFPQPVISAINEFFVSQMDSMLVCDCCGTPVQHLQSVGQAKLCKSCYKKINTPEWEADEYEDNEKVEVNRAKTLKIANKNNFPTIVIEGINKHYDSKIQKGLICGIDGGLEQKLKVFKTHCVLYTSSDFQTEEMSQRYGKALKRSRPNSSSFGANAATALVLSSLIPGGGLVSKGIRAAASAATDKILSNKTATNNVLSNEGMFRVIKGKFQISYQTYSFADFGERGDGEKDVGFIRFARNNGNHNDDIVFLFRYNDSKAKKVYQSICQSIEEYHHPQDLIQDKNVPTQKSTPSPKNNFAAHDSQQNPPQVSIADEILKFKQLLDMGAITQEEFDAKKKELLNL